MLNIKLDENIGIEADTHQYILKQYTGKLDKEGKEVANILGYHPTINSAFKNYIAHAIKNSDCTSIKEVIELYNNLEQKIDSLVKEEI